MSQNNGPKYHFQVIDVREATPDEFEEAGRVTASAWKPWDDADSESWEEFRQRIADVESRALVASVFVAVRHGEILGSVTLESRHRLPDEDYPAQLADDEAHVRLLGVAPSAQRQGIGRMLMEHCISVARSQGKRRLTLNTGDENTAARSLYEELGFVRREDITRPNGLVIRSYELTL